MDNQNLTLVMEREEQAYHSGDGGGMNATCHATQSISCMSFLAHGPLLDRNKVVGVHRSTLGT